MNIVKDSRNDLLNRRELKFVVESESNPGMQKALEMVSSNFKADAENIAVKAVKSKFGRNTFLIDAFVYDSAADKTRVEQKKKEKKAKGGSK